MVRELEEWGSLALPLVPWLARPLFEINVFEVDALPIQSSLSGASLTIKKANCQVLTSHLFL